MKPIKTKKASYINNYSIAPYNFVSLPDESIARYKNIKDLPRHNIISKENLLNGYIEYTIEAKTPIMISNGKHKKNAYFFKNLEDKYAIPANTIRGAIRTNSQILGLSDLVGKKDEKGKYPNTEIEDNKFLFRDIASKGILKKQYNKVLAIKGRPPIARNLKVGYIYKKDKDYYIKPSKKLKENEMYFKIKEYDLRKIVKEDIKDINYMYTKELLNKEIDIKKANKKRDRRTKDSTLDRVKYKGYRPYFTKISFDYNNDSGKAKVTNIYKLKEDKISGYLLSSNYMRGKLAHYIIPEPNDNGSELKIPDDTIFNYIEDMVRTKKAEIKNGNINVKDEFKYYALPKEGEEKPVFYIKAGGAFNIGFTPNLRVMYKNSILDGVDDKNKDLDGIDYVDSIYGFSNKPYIDKDNKEIKYNYKSRVSFTDVVSINSPKVDEESSINMILGPPSATSYPLYIKQENKKLKTYEDKDFRIRGIKEYWLKDYIEDTLEDKPNESMNFKMHPLKEGSRFKGKIYFKNLKEDELGLLLWSINIAPNSNLNIGMAKPYGFGRIKIYDIGLQIEDIEKKYGEFSFDYYKKEDIDKYIKIYKEYVNKHYLNNKDIDDLKNIRELKKIKTYVVDKKDKDFYTYMDFKGYRQKRPLPELLTYPNNSPDIKKKNKYNYKESNNRDKRNNRNSQNKVSEDKLKVLQEKFNKWN